MRPLKLLLAALALAAVPAVALADSPPLDWFGAARIMALADPNDGQPDGPAVLPMLEENLRDVPARVLSPAGKALMPAKRDLLAKWLETLSAETDGFKTL
jgi:uncharacterized protein